MKGISIAIETVIYLILGVTVLSITLFFFLSQAGPAQDQYTLEANRNRFCGAYVTLDFECKGTGGHVVQIDQSVLKGIGTACKELSRRNIYPNPCTDVADLRCIQSCCFTCPK
jgi:hypothetical protein